MPSPVMEKDPPATTATPAHLPRTSGLPQQPRKGSRRKLVLAIVIVLLLAGLIVGGPKLKYTWTHVSTDDATVNSHVTYLSSRVEGVALKVLVDDNAYVEAGTPIVELDPEPFRVTVEQRQAALARAKVGVDQQLAALEVSQAELEQARSQARAQFAGLRGSWYLLATVQDLVRFEVASLQSSVAGLKQQQANLKFAQQEYDRAINLPGQVMSQEEVDRRSMALKVAQEQVNASEQSAQQTRALLGLPADKTNPGAVPEGISQDFSGTQYALAQTQQALAALGIARSALPSVTGKPGEWKLLLDHVEKITEDVRVEQVPAVQAARARR